jgi:tRNA A37 threonylcarbamoyltransferase TsaD
MTTKTNFPYLSLVVGRSETQLVLTRGVGLHTIVGMSVDLGLGETLRKIYREGFVHHLKTLQNPASQEEFIRTYNNNPFYERSIPHDYFEFLSGKIDPIIFIEKLAEFGDPTQFSLPIPMVKDNSFDISFTGFSTAVAALFYKSMKKPNYK